MPDPLIFSATTPRLNLPLLYAGQAQKELFHNEALTMIDAQIHCAIQGTLDSPHNQPQEGETWRIGQNSQGIWQDKEDILASYQNDNWIYIKATEGMSVYDLNAKQRVFFRDNAWGCSENIEKPLNGQNIDGEARAAINQIITSLQVAGILKIL